jgi:hypothetical protein
VPVLVLNPGNMKLYVAIAEIGFISALHAFLEEQAAFMKVLSTLVAAAKPGEVPKIQTRNPHAKGNIGARARDWGPNGQDLLL